MKTTHVILGTVLAASPFALLVASNVAHASATASPCTPAHTQVWASSEGNGTAGTTYYEIEFSNTGSTCTLRGFPTVQATNSKGTIGKPATDRGAASTILLQTSITAHVTLGVVDTGALCSNPLSGTGLRVVPPGEKFVGEQGAISNFPVEVCSNASSLNVSPIQAHVGIPLYTN
jgi:hypothetical protein